MVSRLVNGKTGDKVSGNKVQLAFMPILNVVKFTRRNEMQVGLSSEVKRRWESPQLMAGNYQW